MKKTRKLRKWLLMTSAALLVAALSVGVTLAYLTDTDSVVNTFTVGSVQIELNETDVDNDNNTKENAYHLLPGQTYTKDPTVTIKADSEPSYVRMFVTVQDCEDLHDICFYNEKSEYLFQMGNVSRVLLEKFTTGVSSEWKCTDVSVDMVEGGLGVYEFRYQNVTEKKSSDQPLPALFTEIKVPEWFDNEMLKSLSTGYTYWGGMDSPSYRKAVETASPFRKDPFQITIRAEAIQAAGFANADEAWAAFDAQHN